MNTIDTPFCFVAEKDGHWFGVTAGDYDSVVKRFYRDFAGYEIKRIATRDAWMAYRDAVPMAGKKSKGAIA